ncbi:hypothetical protein EZV62_017809 [Acer yangbiense]|uniref:60S ribosomal protein L34 n=1 Tax=Acer yangbiense TaxID=1000413 RepID=A0A5C7HJV2_9ROSI|nr:hypothetical protein EZV62_017809 [Acer yangbiense]
MVQRLTYRKRHSYATKSNQHRIVKTPGGKLVYQTTKKRASGPKCPVTGKRIQGNRKFEVLAAPGNFNSTVMYLLTLMCRQIQIKSLEEYFLVIQCPLFLQIPHLRPTEYKRSRLARNRRTVNRAYGGVLSGGAVRERIIRAFLVEEQKIVKKVLKIQKTKEKQAGKS